MDRARGRWAEGGLLIKGPQLHSRILGGNVNQINAAVLEKAQQPHPSSAGPWPLWGSEDGTQKPPGCDGWNVHPSVWNRPCVDMFLQGKPSGAALCGASLLEGMPPVCPVLGVLRVHTALCCAISVSHMAFSRKLVSLCWEANGQLLIGCEPVFFFFFFPV